MAHRSRLKIRIFVRDQGRPEMQSAGILLYVEDLHEGATPISGKKTFLRSLLVKIVGEAARSRGPIRAPPGTSLAKREASRRSLKEGKKQQSNFEEFGPPPNPKVAMRVPAPVLPFHLIVRITDRTYPESSSHSLREQETVTFCLGGPRSVVAGSWSLTKTRTRLSASLHRVRLVVV